MTKRYLGNIITQNPTAPAGDLANSAAKGVWSLEEQLAYQKAGLWPVPGNFPLDVEDVFSTYLYTGTGANQTITNGINLDGEGGLVWGKNRTSGITSGHYLTDTERGVDSVLYTERSDAAITYDPNLSSFNSNGFTLNNNNLNINGRQYASWTFRKAPKFFDCVTWTGDGSSTQTISHNLGSTPGIIICKRTSSTGLWISGHRYDYSKYLTLNTTNAAATWNGNWSATDTTFTAHLAGNPDYSLTNSGSTYVAYLFAHNDGDGGFGPDGDADIIKCGSYTGDGIQGRTLDIGFEPQWYLIKRTDSSDDWYLFDVLRGASTSLAARLRPNTSDEEDNAFYYLYPNANGLTFDDANGTPLNTSGGTYIYIAIRRGPLAAPTVGTGVFAMDQSDGTEPSFDSGFPVDFAIRRTAAAAYTLAQARLTGATRMATNVSDAEVADTENTWDHMEGWSAENNTSYLSWMWKRASKFMDCVAFDGGGAGDVVSHNLGVKPDLMIYKRRSAANDWIVYNSIDGANYAQFFNKTDARESQLQWWNNTEPTAANFTTGSKCFSGSTYIAYLFATLAGISKVGGYTGNGGSQTIDCGFTSGARFILIKRTDAAGNWYFWDTEQGIVAGNSPHMTLNTTDAQVTTDDSIDPASSGFIVNQVSATDVNVSSATYIFYAIA